MSNFRQVDRETGYLLPPSVDDWLPERHLAHFVVEVLEQLDLSPFVKAYRGSGSAAHHPSVLLGLLIYGYASGVYSSRKLERASYDSVAFRFIAANDHRDHDTITTFRRRFLTEIEQLFVVVLLLARQAGMVKLGTVALDGTKIHADASRHSALSWRRACEIEARPRAEVAELMALAEAAEAGPRPKDQINLTDPDSAIMPVAGGGFEQCYNAQATVTADSLLVVTADVVQAANDKREIEPALAALARLPEALGTPESLLADSGYFSQANVEACAVADIAPLIAQAREHHHLSWRDRFAEAPPAPEDPTPLEAMRHHLATPEGRALYALRKQTPEPVFGIIKSVMGFRQFSLRGLEQVKGEWNLVTLAWNIKRMFALSPA